MARGDYEMWTGCETCDLVVDVDKLRLERDEARAKVEWLREALEIITGFEPIDAGYTNCRTIARDALAKVERLQRDAALKGE